MITVTIHGERGEGKTVLGEFIQRQLGTHGVRAELEKGGNPRGPDHDTRDVTETPELPPHRFALFEKGREWAYGRGLEINPSHIPAMLDRMEEDGWHLQCVFGGIEPTKVGMLFYRRQPSVFEAVHGYGDWPRATTREAEESDNMKAWKAGTPLDEIDAAAEIRSGERGTPQLLGTMGPWGVWVEREMPEDMRACIRTAISTAPCGPGGMGRGLEA